MNSSTHIDDLFDAIDLIESGDRASALILLRGLIRDNPDNEDAWLWMSVAVDSIDRSVVCLDNVVRINPDNQAAASALYRLQADEIASQSRRNRLRLYRDSALIALWTIVLGLLFALACGLPYAIVT